MMTMINMRQRKAKSIIVLFPVSTQALDTITGLWQTLPDLLVPRLLTPYLHLAHLGYHGLSTLVILIIDLLAHQCSLANPSWSPGAKVDYNTVISPCSPWLSWSVHIGHLDHLAHLAHQWSLENSSWSPSAKVDYSNVRGPKSMNFPDGKIQRAKTFRTKCVNCFRDKKVRKPFFATNKVSKLFSRQKST